MSVRKNVFWFSTWPICYRKQVALRGWLPGGVGLYPLEAMFVALISRCIRLLTALEDSALSKHTSPHRGYVYQAPHPVWVWKSTSLLLKILLLSVNSLNKLFNSGVVNLFFGLSIQSSFGGYSIAREISPTWGKWKYRIYIFKQPSNLLCRLQTLSVNKSRFSCLQQVKPNSWHKWWWKRKEVYLSVCILRQWWWWLGGGGVYFTQSSKTYLTFFSAGQSFHKDGKGDKTETRGSKPSLPRKGGRAERMYNVMLLLRKESLGRGVGWGNVASQGSAPLFTFISLSSNRNLSFMMDTCGLTAGQPSFLFQNSLLLNWKTETR